MWVRGKRPPITTSPLILLIVIIGIAVAITMMVTSNQKEAKTNQSEQQ
ncbi:hypothetical protein BH11CYA1_BH11CYA1_37600 [soil metagenome]